jgi:Zn-dependent peptidase ImmA (M78 family)/transcriptional regulator with XRE-family HTH domain
MMTDLFSGGSPITRSRLIAARQAEGWTLTEVANKLNVSPALVSMWETGARTADGYLDALSKEFDRPPYFFTAKPLDEVSADAVSFRSRKSLTARVREQTLARTRFATGAVHPFIANKVKLPVPGVPDYSGENPEVAANRLRMTWGIGNAPIAHVVHLLEAKGVETYWLNIDSDSVDAVSMRLDNTPFVFLNLKKIAGERGRFDACHELGHLVLHGGKRSDDLDDGEIEAEADCFASAFLMPRQLIDKHGTSSARMESLLPLKRLFGVSLQAIARRLRDVGIVSQPQYVSFQKELSRRGQIKSEPQQLQREHSGLHPQIKERLSSQGVSPEEFCRQIALDARDVAELMPTFAPELSSARHLASVFQVEIGGLG